MQLAIEVLVLLHLIGFAALFGGLIVQARSTEPEVNAAMVYGALTQLLTGIALLVIGKVGGEPVNWVPISIKTGVSLARIQALNPKLDSQSLQTGQRVKLSP